jgi:hypothetical protein
MLVVILLVTPTLALVACGGKKSGSSRDGAGASAQGADEKTSLGKDAGAMLASRMRALHGDELRPSDPPEMLGQAYEALSLTLKCTIKRDTDTKKLVIGCQNDNDQAMFVAFSFADDPKLGKVAVVESLTIAEPLGSRLVTRFQESEASAHGWLSAIIRKAAKIRRAKDGLQGLQDADALLACPVDKSSGGKIKSGKRTLADACELIAKDGNPDPITVKRDGPNVMISTKSGWGFKFIITADEDGHKCAVVDSCYGKVGSEELDAYWSIMDKIDRYERNKDVIDKLLQDHTNFGDL